MRRLADADPANFSGVRYILTDMDETLTYQGRLSAATYGALERLQQAGVKVIPVTAASAGWCDQMARMWPVDGVIGENGGLFFERTEDGAVGAQFWNAAPEAAKARLDRHVAALQSAFPFLELAQDQPFRLTSIAFKRPPHNERTDLIFEYLKERGLSATLNNLWLLLWEGAYDKLSMSLRILTQRFGEPGSALCNHVFYSGDSENDAPMFALFRLTAGVSTVRRHLPNIPIPPAWISDHPGGAGFVEAAELILKGRTGRS